MRELITRPRRRLFYTKRVAYVIGVILFLLIFAAMTPGGSTLGLSIFMALSYTSLGAMYILPLFIASSMVMQERKDRTLGLLFMTDLTGTTIVSGKFLTASFSALIIISSVLPLFILTTVLGGVQAEQVLKAFGILLGTAYLATSAGLFTGIAAKSEQSVTWIILVIGFLLFIVIPAGVAISLGVDSPAFTAVTPWHAMTLLRTGIQMDFIHLNPIYCCLAGTPFLVASYILLPKRVFTHGTQATRVQGRVGHLKGNPVFWREFYFSLKSTPANLLRDTLAITIILASVVAGVIAADHFKLLTLTAAEKVDTSALAFAGICMIRFTLGGLWNCCGTFVDERTDRTLDVLLTTPITEKQIALGKFKAVFFGGLPWLIASCLAPMVLTVWPGHMQLGWYMLAIAIAGYSIWFCFAQLAMWFSLRFKRAMALTACFGTWVGWNLVGQSVLLPVMFFGVVVGATAGAGSDATVGSVITALVLATVYGALHIGLGMIFQQILLSTIRSTALRSSNQAVSD